jgi:hypothetical protein
MRAGLRAVAARQYGTFTGEQALRWYSRAEMRARVDAGHWIKVFAGTYRSATAEPTARLRIAAAGLAIGREVPGCLTTAAELHGFGILHDPVTHVAVPEGLACLRRPTLWPHQPVLEIGDLVRLPCGTVVTGADRTAVELARTRSRPDALAVLDAALAAGACTPESLMAEVHKQSGLRGILQARELVPLATTGPESPQESRMRLRCHDAKLPRPTVQLPVEDERGRARRWLDLAWEWAMVALEYDGAEGHEGSERRRADRVRHNWLQGRRWTMFYATDIDIARRDAPLYGVIAAALLR